jgi:CBS domain containing-hemolysin-like protein
MIFLLLIGCTLSVLLSAMSVSLRSLSTPYLRHWARKGDVPSKALYPLKARGTAVLLTVELLRAIAISGSLVLLSVLLPSFFAWLIGSALLFFAFIVLTEIYLRQLGTRLLVFLSPILLTVSQKLGFIILPLGRTFDRFIAEQPRVLTRSELGDSLQAVTAKDTDLSDDELRIIRHSLDFGRKTVHDVMTPRSVMAIVKQDDILSPLLLDELHKTGHSRFPVFASDESVAGVLYTKDLIDLKSHTKVTDIMHKPVHFVNENRELDHVLQAFIRTKQHLFLVVNEFAEITGLITIEDIVEQILGKPIIDEFDKYDSMRDVAEARAKIVRQKIKMVE